MQSDNHELVDSKSNSVSSEDSLGQLLVSAGKIKGKDIDKILTYTKKKNIRFGDAAIALRLVKDKDIKQALSTQYSYDYLELSQAKYSKSLVAAYKPFSKQVEILRTIRSQLMLRYFNQDHKLLMITSAEKSEGKSYITANLAVVFSQLGLKVLLIDANLRDPVQDNLFSLTNETGLSTILSGLNRDMSGVIKKISEFKTLSVLTSGPIPPNPSELLSTGYFRILLEVVKEHFDIILLDTSATIASSDNDIIAAQVGAVLTVANKNSTRYNSLKSMIEQYRSYNVDIVGTVMNKV